MTIAGWLPAPLHRAALRAADRLRRVLRRVRKPLVVGVSLLGIDDEGRILLVRHSYGSGAWTLPGGGLARGEAPDEAARRELREELACEAHDLRYVAALQGQLSGAPHIDHLFTFTVRETPRPDGRELIAASLFAAHALPDRLSPRTVRRIAAWREWAG